MIIIIIVILIIIIIIKKKSLGKVMMQRLWRRNIDEWWQMFNS